MPTNAFKMRVTAPDGSVREAEAIEMSLTGGFMLMLREGEPATGSETMQSCETFKECVDVGMGHCLAHVVPLARRLEATGRRSCPDCRGTGHSGNLHDELCPTCAGGGDVPAYS